MKKITLIGISVFGMFAFSYNVSGQITIGTADLPYAGLNITQEEDTTSTTLSAGTPGAGKTWSFGAMLPQKASSIMFTTPGATKYSAVFPTSNLADSTVGGNGHYYFINNSSEFAVEGVQEYVSDPTYGVTFLVELNLNPVFTQAQLPGSYGQIYSGVSYGKDEFAPTGIVALVYDSIKVTTQITYSDSIDAWGTMTTPTGTYPVLRQNHHEVDIDSANGRSSAGKWSNLQASNTAYHQYNWYTTGANFILVQMNVDPVTGAYLNTKWDNSVPATAGIQELSQSSDGILAYPNPCTSQITFQATSKNDAQYISVFDITGRQVEKLSIASGMISLNTSSYAGGMYLYNVLDKSGNIVGRGKFSVQK